MDFSYNETQQLLFDGVTKFVSDHGGVEQHCTTSEEEKQVLWRKFAELGWLAAPFSEQHGGLAAGSADMMLITEALGKGLLSEPFQSTVVCCGGFLRHGGSEQQQEQYIPSIVDGSKQWAFAFAEKSSGYDLASVSLSAESNDGFRLNGEKIAVVNGANADYYVVSARTSGDQRANNGISLFVVDASAPGLERESFVTLDGRTGANLRFSNVAVGAESILGEEGSGRDLLERVLNESIVAIAGEALGAMQQLLDATVEYTKTREQFGQPISKFQVLQHRMVDMYLRLEETRSLLFDAAIQVDTRSDAAAKACAALKVKVCEAGRFVSQQAVQLHGGIGMTDELAVGHFLKRLQVLATLYGDEDYYLEKYVALSH